MFWEQMSQIWRTDGTSPIAAASADFTRPYNLWYGFGAPMCPGSDSRGLADPAPWFRPPPPPPHKSAAPDDHCPRAGGGVHDGIWRVQMRTVRQPAGPRYDLIQCVRSGARRALASIFIKLRRRQTTGAGCGSWEVDDSRDYERPPRPL